MVPALVSVEHGEIVFKRHYCYLVVFCVIVVSLRVIDRGVVLHRLTSMQTPSTVLPSLLAQVSGLYHA
jgi:hypothetical protein